jgi:hypothetical protein
MISLSRSHSCQIQPPILTTVQWLVTHVSLAWRTKQAKQSLSSKYLPSTVAPPNDIQPPSRHVPVSSITFASFLPTPGSQSPLQSLHQFKGRRRVGAGYDEDSDDEFEFNIDFPSSSIPDIRNYRNEQQEYFKHALASSSMSLTGISDLSSSSTLSVDPASQYTTFAFSTGQLLEDDLRYHGTSFVYTSSSNCSAFPRRLPPRDHDGVDTLIGGWAGLMLFG